MSPSAVEAATPATAPSSTRMRRSVGTGWWLAYLSVCGVGLLVAALGFKRSGQLYLGMSLALWVTLLAMWVRVPRVALAVSIVCTLISDIVTVSWWPYIKNLSSLESITYLDNGLSVTPMEVTLCWALMVTFIRNLSTIGRLSRPLPLKWAMVALLCFVASGFVIGLSRGGDSTVAMYEARPLIYLPLLYVLVVNVCRTTRDYRYMFDAAIVAIVIQSCLSLRYAFKLAPAARADIESLNEHGSSIGMNLVIAATILAFALRQISWRRRVVLFAAAVPVLWVYLLAQRRAAIVALVAAMILFAVILFWRQRATFWKVVPITVVLVVGYVGAFWNADSTAGFPAQAVKAVIAPDSISAEDQSSDLYRKIEDFNLNVTIRSAPVTGLGFGRPFLRPIPLPNINSFALNPYLPHNSLLWIWIKLGFAGFVTVLFLFGRTMMLGARRVRAASRGLDLHTASLAVLTVAMYAIYVYVDVAWEARNVTLLALAMGLCTTRSQGDPSDEVVGAVERSDTAVSRLDAVKTPAPAVGGPARPA